MNLRRSVWTAILGIALLSQISEAQEITVAAAADLQLALKEVAARFEKETGKGVRVIYGSSGNFFQQIQNGARFDLFFSANLDHPKKLEAARLNPTRDVLPICERQNCDLGSKRFQDRSERGSKALLDPTVKKIAIANPEHAPYGQAAVDWIVRRMHPPDLKSYYYEHGCETRLRNRSK